MFIIILSLLTKISTVINILLESLKFKECHFRFIGVNGETVFVALLKVELWSLKFNKTEKLWNPTLSFHAGARLLPVKNLIANYNSFMLELLYFLIIGLKIQYRKV